MIFNRQIRIFVFVLILSVFTGPADGQEFQWKGKTGSSWHSSDNWNPAGRIPGEKDKVVLTNVTGSTEIVLEKEAAAGSLRFHLTQLATCTLKGSSIKLSDGGRICFLKLPKDVGIKQNASSIIDSDLKLAGDLTLENLNRHYLGGEYLRINGQISGAGRITVRGVENGLVQLKGDNRAWTGELVIQSGGIKLSHENGIGSGKSPIRLEGGVFVIGARISTHRDFQVSADSILDSHGPNGTHDGTFTVQKGATLKITNGGGNTMTLRGPIIGDGRLKITSGGTTFAGSRPNLMTGATVIAGIRGTTVFAKDDGVNIVAGDLEVKENGAVQWKMNEQVADDSTITFDGKSPSFDINGKRETFGVFNLQSDGRIKLGAASARIRFADSSMANWNPDASLLIMDAISGEDQVAFGNREQEQGLTDSQIRQIGFVNPAGLPTGTYSARMNGNGDLTPGRKVVPVNLPFDPSPAAHKRREAMYQIAGLKKLAQHPSSKKECVVSLFGDSITWGGGYVNQIQNVVKSRQTGIQIINHGCNGAGVKIIRDGDDAKVHVGNTSPKSFLETITTDRSNIAVVFIGVNDVWWRKTSPEEFERGLRDIVKQAKSKDVKIVLATLALMKEKVGERNPKCDRYAEITRKVAIDTEATLVDLRSAFWACLENESITVKPNGQWSSDASLLTHDGVHMNSKGNELIANLIAAGICDALSKEKN